MKPEDPMKREAPEGAICASCAKRPGLRPVDWAVGIWLATCAQCGKERDCTDARRDYVREER